MFARYTITGAGALATVQANVLNDVIAICTGETNKANLSATCDQANTYIVGTEPAGWTLHDSSITGYLTTRKAIKAPNADGTWKYVLMTTDLVSGTIFNVWPFLYENWDNGTGGGTAHTGTNLARSSYPAVNGAWPYLNYNAGDSLFLSVSARRLVIWSRSATGGYCIFPILISERERVDPWDTVVAGYPVGVYSEVNSTGGAISPRTRNSLAVDVKPATYAYNTAAATATASSYATGTLRARDATFQPVHPVLPIYLRGPSSLGHLHLGGQLQGGIYMTTNSTGVTGDEVSYNGQQYVLLQDTSNARFMIPKF
jgi:hypothetical protein